MRDGVTKESKNVIAARSIFIPDNAYTRIELKTNVSASHGGCGNDTWLHLLQEASPTQKYITAWTQNIPSQLVGCNKVKLDIEKTVTDA